jgi:petrobactin synthase
MIRVHCFVSCVCQALERVAGADQRPFYFGVWDAPFFVSEGHRLEYHAPSSDQAFFCEWYERLYGTPIHDWYDRSTSKEANLRTLQRLVEARPPDRQVMVMLDLFRLPERENKFNQNPFPHYVMLEATREPELWLMRDPDFRWEGTLPKVRLLDAVRSPAVEGGYFFDAGAIRPAEEDVVRSYFAACLKFPRNPLTASVREIVRAHLDGRAEAGIAGLAGALKQLPVLAMRKYAYEHGFAFFWRALALDVPDFEHCCDEIDALVKGYTALQYRAIKLSLALDRSLVPDLLELLDRQDELERRLKCKLVALYETWCADLDAPVRPLRVNPAGTLS